MLKTICKLRAWTVVGLGAFVLATMGQQCAPPAPSVPPPSGATVHVELINQTSDKADPGLIVNGAPFDLGMPLEPGEVANIDHDCVGGTTLQTDGIQLAQLGPIASDNTPLVQDDAEFKCGDNVSFILVNNGTDVLFTRVEVNGQFVTD